MDKSTKVDDWTQRFANMACEADEANELRAEFERLQRENGALARTYAACEKMLRERTEQLNQADAEIQRLRDWIQDWTEHYLDDDRTVAGFLREARELLDRDRDG
jgi:nitrate/nitrite-specific signal transduction histidine kinase